MVILDSIKRPHLVFRDSVGGGWYDIRVWGLVADLRLRETPRRKVKDMLGKCVETIRVICQGLEDL